MKRKALRILLAAAVLGAALCLVLAAFGPPVGDSIRMIASGAFGDKFGIARTLVKASPLLLAGLGMVVAWRAGMYNIGGEGQLIVGTLLAATLYRLAPDVQPWALLPALIVLCMLGGAAWAGIAAWLSIRRGVQVVISTILLNFVALQLLAWAVGGPLREKSGQLPQTDALPGAAMFLRPDRQTDLHLGVLLGVFAAIALAFYLFRSVEGFRLRLVGENLFAARVAKVPVAAVQMRAMLLSGALCGLAGASDYLGVTGQLDRGFSQQWGFLAIPVALIGGLHPIGALASSLFFGALFAGTDHLGRFTNSSSSIVYVIQALAVLGFLALHAWLSRTEPEGAPE